MKPFNLEALIRENVKRLTPYSSARDDFNAGSDDYIFLDANESPFGNGLNRYPDPRQKIVKTLLAEQHEVSVDNILLGNGSDEVLDLLYRAFCEPGKDAVITAPPTYGMYKVLAGVNAVANKEVLLLENFQLDVASILAEADESVKMILLCSPNNPTGNAFRKSDLIELITNFHGLVVIDEAYIDFSGEESWMSRLNKYPNLVVTQTLSKAYGLAAIRIGICYASPEIIDVLNRIKPPYNINQLSQEKALRRLLNFSVVENEVEKILKERIVLAGALNEVSWIKTIFPSDANFLLVRVDDAGKRYNELLEAGFVVRNRSGQPLCENTLRITVGTRTENKKLIAQIKKMK